MKLKKPLFVAAIWIFITGTGSALMLMAGFYLYLSPKLPPVESIRDVRLETPLRVFSADGKLIGEFGTRRRYPISYEEIPQTYINALLAAEDADFFSHSGVSIKGLLRAVSQLVLTGRKGPGGSTLTMQLTRHIFLSLERTFSRKFNEILLALRIEKELSKKEILELYVNKMFLGNRAYGIKAAAEIYYGKNLDELTLPEYAMMVGVLKGPSVLNPIYDPDRAIARRNYVLSRMRKLEYITNEEYRDAVGAPLTASVHGSRPEVNAPYVAEMARAKVIELFGQAAYTSGYQVITTVRSDLQHRAQSAVVSGLLDYDQRHGYRGPEMRLELNDAPLLTPTHIPPSPATMTDQSEEGIAETPRFEQRDFTLWKKTLSEIPLYGQLEAAAVIGVQEQSIVVLRRDGTQQQIPWDQGLSNARLYISENSRGPAPASASDVVALGDVVRIKQVASGEWVLSQVPAAQASLVSLDPKDGAIISLVGGFDFDHSNFNRAIQAKRQPGSNFKPFIYTAALENGFSAATIVNDAPIVIEDKQLENTWRPENSSDRFYGPTRLRKALYKSINLVSIRVLNRVGVSNTIESLEKFGFDADELPRDLSLALGAHAVTPMEIATGYAIFANGGYRVNPYLVDVIKDVEGDTVYKAAPATVCRRCDEESSPETRRSNVNGLTNMSTASDDNPEHQDAEYALSEEPFSLEFETKKQLEILTEEDYPRAPRVISEQVAYIIDSMLKDVVRKGTGYKAWRAFKRPDLGGKTGTTNNFLDAWFSGYHPNIVTTAWVGFDQNTSLGRGEYGGTAALPIWIDFMSLALEEQPVIIPEQPTGIVSVRIDPDTGKRARTGDPDAIFEIFRTDNLPLYAEQEESNPWESEEVLTDELGF